MQSSSDIGQKVRNFFQAYERHDRRGVEDLLAHDFVFTSPTDDDLDRAAYLEYWWPCNDQMRRVDVEKIFIEGDEAFVRYRIERTDGRHFRNTDFMQFRNGKVSELQAYFGKADRVPEPDEMD